METVKIQAWYEDANNIPDSENLILKNLGPEHLMHNSLEVPPNLKPVNIVRWRLPPPGFMKLNFDGASKGNPGPTGYGGVIHTDQGKVTYIYYGFIGHATNNATKLEGLILASRVGRKKLIIEGDSHIIIHMLSKIMHGAPISRINQNWRMEDRLHQLRQIVQNILVLIPQHVLRSWNTLDDKLTNASTQVGPRPIIHTWED